MQGDQSTQGGRVKQPTLCTEETEAKKGRNAAQITSLHPY